MFKDGKNWFEWTRTSEQIVERTRTLTDNYEQPMSCGSCIWMDDTNIDEPGPFVRRREHLF